MGRTYQSVIVNAPIGVVWETIRNFHDMSWAPNVVESLTAVGDRSGDQVGARRVLNGVFEETLVGLDDLEYTFQYRIDDGPSPVSKQEVDNYIGTVRARAVTEGDRCFVEWSSHWDAKNDAAVAFCHGIYVALLTELKAKFA